MISFASRVLIAALVIWSVGIRDGHTKVYNPETYNSDNLDTICDYEVKGGGGTDFDCIFTYLKDEQIEPKRLVVFTDGYPFGSWGDENYADTVWIIHGNTTVVPPWGQYSYYEKETQHA